MPYYFNFDREHPIIFDQPLVDQGRTKYSLTLSAILERNDGAGGALEVQKRLLESINTTDLTGQGIYQYPGETLHFSIINFSDLGSSKDANQEVYESRLNNKIEAIKDAVKDINEDSSFKPQDREVECGFVYTKESESIAFQAFLGVELADYVQLLRQKLNRALVEQGVGKIDIKGYKDPNSSGKEHRFAVNLARFFRLPSSKEYALLVDSIRKLNNESHEKPIYKFTLKEIAFVCSNNWLSNEQYDLECKIHLVNNHKGSLE